MAHELHEQQIKAPEDNYAAVNLSNYIHDELFKNSDSQTGMTPRRVQVGLNGEVLVPCNHDIFEHKPTEPTSLTFTNPYTEKNVADHALKMVLNEELDENKDGFVSKEEIGNKYLELQKAVDPNIRHWNPDAVLDEKALAYLLKNYDKIENQVQDSKNGKGLSVLDIALTALAAKDAPVFHWPSLAHHRPKFDPIAMKLVKDEPSSDLPRFARGAIDIKPV